MLLSIGHAAKSCQSVISFITKKRSGGDRPEGWGGVGGGGGWHCRKFQIGVYRKGSKTLTLFKDKENDTL